MQPGELFGSTALRGSSLTTPSLDVQSPFLTGAFPSDGEFWIAPSVLLHLIVRKPTGLPSALHLAELSYLPVRLGIQMRGS